MNDQSVLSIPDPGLWALAPAQISPSVCLWCGDLHGLETEILPRLLVDSHGQVLGALADEWCCTSCGHEWDEPLGILR
jgi:hypothetical protein